MSVDCWEVTIMNLWNQNDHMFPKSLEFLAWPLSQNNLILTIIQKYHQESHKNSQFLGCYAVNKATQLKRSKHEKNFYFIKSIASHFTKPILFWKTIFAKSKEIKRYDSILPSLKITLIVSELIALDILHSRSKRMS